MCKCSPSKLLACFVPVCVSRRLQGETRAGVTEMLQGLKFACTHLSLFYFSVSCLPNQLTAQHLIPRFTPPDCRKSCGACLSGYSCCLAGGGGVLGGGNKRYRVVVGGTDPNSPTVAVGQKAWIIPQRKHPQKGAGTAFAIFHWSINL